MDDLIKSLKAQLYDRVASPLLSSFLISWAVWNHRIFVVMTSSDLKLQQKFTYADEVLYPHFYEVAFKGFIWPLLSALALLFIYPIPGRWVYQYVRKEQKRLKEIQQKIDDETPITQEDAKELRAAIRKADAEFQKEIAERDKLIVRLREEIEKQDAKSTIDNENSTINEPAQDTEDEVESLVDPATLNSPSLEADQLKLLRLITEAESGLVKEAAISAGGETRVIAQYNLDQLLRLGLVKLIKGNRELARYIGTAAGRATLVKLDRHRSIMKALTQNRSQ
jgi:hypothetical protein